MRVISGTARGKRLKRVPGDTTRPIMDRVKENLFNILGTDYVVDCRWLDLFGGTGQVGIEALSRGATHVQFLDLAQAAITTMRENLAWCGLAERASVRRTDALAFLKTATEQFDLIYIAPPQYKEMWVAALVQVDERAAHLLVDDGLTVVQIDPKEYRDVELANLRLSDQRRYGSTLLCFYEVRPADNTFAAQGDTSSA